MVSRTMKHLSRHLFVAATVVLVSFSMLRAAEPVADLVPTQLRCESLTDPLGVDVVQPSLSWVLEAVETAERGARQTAYQILVATSKELLEKDQGDLWDSKKVVSDATLGVEYAGKPLTSRTVCFWKVRVWDAKDRVSA
jgi:alpha-L-rhamnosidase